MCAICLVSSIPGPTTDHWAFASSKPTGAQVLLTVQLPVQRVNAERLHVSLSHVITADLITPPLPHPAPASPLQMASLPSRRTNAIVATRTGPGAAKWDGSVPPLLRPLVRAYVLGYAFSVGPRLLALILHHVLTIIRKPSSGANGTARKKKPGPKPPFAEAMRKILRAGFEWQRFPAFCAALVGGSTLLEVCTPLPVIAATSPASMR